MFKPNQGRQTDSEGLRSDSFKAKNEDVSDNIHLFSVNWLIGEYNSKVLCKKEGPSFLSFAADYTQGDIPARDRRSLLEHAKGLETRKTQNLQYELQLKVSGNYMMTHNVNTSDGLTNGASCQIMKVQTVNNSVSIVWVVFAEKDIGKDTRESNRHLYLYSSNIDKAWTPIQKIERQFQVG